jgi:hypothetical protein
VELSVTHKIYFQVMYKANFFHSYMFQLPVLAIIRELKYYRHKYRIEYQ